MIFLSGIQGVVIIYGEGGGLVNGGGGKWSFTLINNKLGGSKKF
jgi:hypothetical protein